MKKVYGILCILLVAISLSACSVFNADVTENYAQDNPLVTTVFLQINTIPQNSNIADEITKWQGDVLTLNAGFSEEDTKITDIDFQDTMQTDGIYTVNLTIKNVPDSTFHKQTRPFKIIRTQTIFNPITLLPPTDVFTYIVGYTAERQHSDSNTDQIVTDQDGKYIYLWMSNLPIEFVDVYPNRPLYYLFVVLGAAVLGCIVYFVSRYIDCKKRKKLL